jgi:uncharacterized protein (DUF39 family)
LKVAELNKERMLKDVRFVSLGTRGGQCGSASCFEAPYP